MTDLTPRPGFNWMQVSWGGPDEPSADRCSYCDAEIPDDSAPLILWNNDGWCGRFCDACMATWWGIHCPDDVGAGDDDEPADVVAAGMPAYWMWETSGALRPAIEAYLSGGTMTGEQIAAMRAYLRQWIMAPAWRGDVIAELRGAIDSLTSRQAIAAWLAIADDAGCDPL